MDEVIGIVGLGAMGRGIAQVYAQAGYPVVATDSAERTRGDAKTQLAEVLTTRVAQGKLSASERDATLNRITITESLGGLRAATLVVEAIIERMDAKQELIAALEKMVSRDTVLATNTSSLSVGVIAGRAELPERVLGLHFFNPAPVMKLVELVAHPLTAARPLARARAVTERAGKTVIACADRPGFIVNRCARPYYGEALALFEEGRAASEIDAAMMAAGYRIGPLALIDLIGADVNLAATQGVHEAMGRHPRYHVFDSLKAQVAEGNLGRKTGRGIIFPEEQGAPPVDGEAIALRVEAALANEAASLLAEGGVSEADIDAAMKLGLNFPRGPFESARAHGLPKVYAELRRLAASAPGYLAGRYDVSPALERLVGTG